METWSFHDFDEYVTTIRDVNVDMLLQRLVHRSWNIRHVDIGGIHIQQGIQGSGDITQGQANSDGYVLYVPLKNENAQRANGRYLDANSIVVLEPGAEFCLSSNIDHEWCSVFLPTVQLTASTDQDRTDRGQCRTLNVPHRFAARYRNLILRILAAVEMFEPLESSHALNSAKLELRRLSTQVITSQSEPQSPTAGRPLLGREEIVRQARQLLDSPASRGNQIADIAAECDVSERTLRGVFQEYFGTAPLRYMQLRQLHNIRHDLRSADPAATTVGEILTHHGIWEFGRFARRYRKTFGELPSHTLGARPR